MSLLGLSAETSEKKFQALNLCFLEQLSLLFTTSAYLKPTVQTSLPCIISGIKIILMGILILLLFCFTVSSIEGLTATYAAAFELP